MARASAGTWCLQARPAVLPFAVALLLGAFLLSGQAQAAPLLGINERGTVAVGNDRVDPGRAVKLARAMGADMIRITIPWEAVQPVPGQWRWDRFDRAIRVFRSQRIQPLIITERAPAWAVDFECSGRACPPTEARMGDWATFVRELARRYPNTAAIEIMHGINTTKHWNTRFGPNPERYARVFAAAAHQIHAVRPQMPVLIGGISAVKRDRTFGSLTPASFLRRFYAVVDRSALRSHDGLATRAYSGIRDIGALRGRVGEHLATLRSLTRRHDPGRSLWLTEAGATTTGPYGMSMKQQSDVIETQLDELRNAPDIAAISIFRQTDRRPSAIPRESGFGLIRVPGFEPKLAYCRLVARVVGPLDAVGCAGKGQPYLGFRGVKRNKRRGTAHLIVQTPGPGRLVLKRKRKLKGAATEVGRARRVRLPLKARGRARESLRDSVGRNGMVKVPVRVVFYPDHGRRAKIGRSVRLILR